MNKRQVDLLINLSSSGKFIPAKDLADSFHVSTKTIYKDADTLLNTLKSTSLRLDVKRGLGLRIQGTILERERVIRRFMDASERKTPVEEFSPRQRRIALAKEIILEGKQLTLKELSERWWISKTSILNDVDRINTIIESSSLQICSNGSELIAIGEEENIQTAAATFIVDASDSRKAGDVTYFSLFFPKKVVQSVLTIFDPDKPWYVELPSYYKFALQVISLVQTQRACFGFHFTDQLKSTLTGSAKAAETILNQISQALRLQFTIADKEWLARNLSAYRMSNDSAPADQNYKPIIDELIARMEDVQGMPFLNKAHLEKQLMYHIPAMILRLKQGLVVKNPLFKDIKTQYPALFGMTWYAISFLEERYQITLSDDEVSFITIYFHVAINQSIPIRRVLVIFNQHGQLRDYVMGQIKHLLPDGTLFLKTNLTAFKSIDLSDVGLIVGVNIPGLVSKVPFIRISPLFDANDQEKLLKAYASYLIRPQTSNEEQHYPVLSKLGDPKLIFWKDSVKDRKEALQFLIKVLENNGGVTHEFGKSLLRRERLGPTEIESGVALPHAAPETVNRLSVAFLILNKPVKWNSTNVFVVILICVPNESISIYHDLVLDIYRLVENKTRVHMIVSLQDTEDLLDLINS
ncbi:MAG: PTS sugar transporter subunit IIA [Sporolactobacillus sp.]